MKKLTEKQKKFCEEYVIDFNATQAAIRAGYSKKTANTIAAQNLAKLSIQNYIKELQKKREERTEVTADMVVKELAKLAFGDISQIYDKDGRMLEPHELPKDVAATISSFKSRRENQGKDEDGNIEFAFIDEYKRYDKTKALELLMRHLGMFAKDNEQSKPEINIPQFNVTVAPKKKD